MKEGDHMPQYVPNLREYSESSVWKSEWDAAQWLHGNTVGFPETWEEIDRGDKIRGYNLYGQDDYEAPPIAGYERLEAFGLARRGEISPDGRRVAFYVIDRAALEAMHPIDPYW